MPTTEAPITKKPHAATISRLLNTNRYGRDFRVRTYGRDGAVRVFALRQDSYEGSEKLHARGYLISRRNDNVFFVTGRQTPA